MALFDNNASGFINRVQNIDKSGIAELRQEVESLTKATADYEQKANEAFSNGVALTKRQKDAYRDYEASIKATASAQKALRDAIDATNEAWRGAKGADKKELADKISAYKELQKAVTAYKSGAQSAINAGSKVYNDKAVKRNVIPDASRNKNGNEVVPKKQVVAQAESLAKATAEAREQIAQKTSQNTSTNEVVPKEQVVAQAEAVVKTADEACKKVAQVATENARQVFKVWDKESGRYIEKAIPTTPQQNTPKANVDNGEQLSNAEKRKRAIERGFYRAPSSGNGGAIASETQQVITLQMLLNEIEATKNRILNAKMGAANSSNILFDANDIKEQEQHLKELLALKKLLWMDDPSKDKPLESEGKSFNELVDLLKTKQAELQDTKTHLINSDNVYADYEKIKQLEKEIENLQAMISQARGNSNSEAFLKAFAGLGHVLEKIGKVAVKGIGQGVGKFFSGFQSGLNTVVASAKQFISTIASIASAVKQFGSTVISVASNAFGTLRSAISSTVGGLKNLVSGGFNLAKRGINSFKAGLKSIKSHMTSIVKKSTPNMMKSLSSIKSMLVRRLKRTFISSIFNQAKEGLQALAKLDSGFNKTMSNIKNGAKQASGNLAGLLGNLVTALEPAIMTVINLLSDLFAKANAVLALITGKATFAVAKKGTDDYAKSLKSAGGAAKDLNHQLYGFDEITRQEDDNSSGSGSGIQYETQTVDGILGNLKSIFDDIKKAFLAGNFEEVGQLLAKALTGAIDKIDDWLVKFRSKAVEWSSNIARILNGMLDPELFTSLGKMLGDGINLVFDVLNTFLTTFHFDEFGQMLAIGINSLFDTVEWDLIGETVANGFNAIWNTLANLYATIDWVKIGNSLATAITSIFGTIKWDLFRDMWVSGINGIVTALWTLITGVDWGSISTQFFNSVVGIINGINWKSISDLLAVGINNLITIFENFVNSDIIVNFGTKLGETLGDTLSQINWVQLALSVSQGLFKIKASFVKFTLGLNLPELATKIADGVNAFFDPQQGGANFISSSEQLAVGLNSIIDTFANLVDPEKGIKFGQMAETIGQGVGDFLKNVEWEKLGEAIGDGILQLTEAFGKLITSLDLPNIATELAKGINAFFDPQQGGASFDNAVKAVSDGVKDIITAFINLIDPEKGIKFNQIAEDIGKGVGDFLKNVDWETLGKAIGDGIGQLTEAFGKLLTSIDLPNIATELAKGINAFFDPEQGGASFEDAIKAVSDGINDVIKAFAKLLSPEEGINFAQISSTIAENINGLVKQTDWATLISTLLALHLDIQQAFWDVIDQIDWEDIGKKLADGLNNIFADEKRFAKLGESISGAVVGILEGIATLIQEIDWDKVVQGVIAFIQGIRWVDVLDAIMNCLLAAVSGVGDLITSLWQAIFGGGQEHVEIPQVLSDDIIDQMKEQMGEAGKMLANELTKSIAENLQGAGSNYEDAKQLFIKSMALIGEGGQKEFEATMKEWNVADETTAAIAENVKQIYATLEAPNATLESVQQKFHENGIYITNGLAEALIGQGEANIAQAMHLLALGVDEETIQALDISHLNENITNYMNETKSDITDIAGALGADVGKEIGGTIPNAVKEALGAGEKEVAAAKDSMVEAASASAQDVQEAQQSNKELGEATEETATAIEANKEDVAKAQQGVHDAIQETMDKLPDEQKKQAEEMMKYIVDGIAEGDPLATKAIETAAKEIVKKAEEILSRKNGVEIAKKLISGMKDAFDLDATVRGKYGSMAAFAREIKQSYADEMTEASGKELGKGYLDGMQKGMHDEYFGDVRSEISDIRLDVYYAFTEWFNHAVGYDITYELMQGLADGLSMNRSSVINWAQSIASDLVQVFKDKLDINSPSKVFEEIGMNVSEGFDIGLEKKGGEIIDTSTALVNAISEEASGIGFNGEFNSITESLEAERENAIDVISSLADAMSDEASGIGLDGVLGSITEGLNDTTDRLLQIANIFSDIANTITEMGGLEIPTIASGQTIPYRTQIESIPSSGNMFGDQDLEDSFYSAFTRAMGSPNAEQQINITLQVDGRKMADIVSKYQRQQGRAWGV